MALNGKAMFPGDFNLKRLDPRILELDNLTARDTDQVVVMLVMLAGFVTCLAVAKMTLFGYAALRKQFQAAVNGRIADTGMFLTQTQIELFR